MKSRVLITGAMGFLGRAVATQFAASGWEVIGLGHGTAADHCPHLARWHTADVTLDALVNYAAEPDLIVHCAGSGSVPFSMTHPLQDFTRTVSGTAAVLEYVRLHSATTRLVYPSSAAVYGEASRLPIEETCLTAPASPYGTHKLMAEALCQSYAKTFGISVAVIRFFSIYGQGLRKQLLWDACRKLELGNHSFEGTGAELRDWLHVEDAARLIECAVGSASASCPIVNGATGTAVTVAQALEELFSAWGSAHSPTFSGTPRPGDPPGYHADTRRARGWGWAPRVTFTKGVSLYVNWFRSAR